MTTKRSTAPARPSRPATAPAHAPMRVRDRAAVPSPAEAPRRAPVAVLRRSLGVANVFALLGDRPVLVDTGVPGSAPAIQEWLRRQGVDPADLSLIVLTHAHRDHLGAAAALRERFGVPIALPDGGLAAARRGHDQYGVPSGFFARQVVARFPKTFEPLEPDVLLAPGQRLDAYGVAAEVIATPGHTDHCMSVVTDAGEAIVGDLLVGSHVLPNRAGVPYLVDLDRAWRQSLVQIGTRPLRRFHPGHGRSFDRSALDRLRVRGRRV